MRPRWVVRSLTGPSAVPPPLPFSSLLRPRNKTWSRDAPHTCQIHSYFLKTGLCLRCVSGQRSSPGSRQEKPPGAGVAASIKRDSRMVEVSGNRGPLLGVSASQALFGTHTETLSRVMGLLETPGSPEVQIYPSAGVLRGREQIWEPGGPGVPVSLNSVTQ